MHHGEQATLLMPNDCDAFYNLGLALSDAGQYKGVVRAYKKALKINPKHNLSANNLGTTYETMGDKKTAYIYEMAAKLDPLHTEAQNNLGALQSENDLDDARDSFTAAIKADPNFVHAYYNKRETFNFNEAKVSRQQIKSALNMIKNSPRKC